jgi:hypothetical protein
MRKFKMLPLKFTKKKEKSTNTQKTMRRTTERIKMEEEEEKPKLES